MPANHFPYLAKKVLIASALGLLFSGGFWLTPGAARPGWLTRTGRALTSEAGEAGEAGGEEASDEENDADQPRPDQPDLALAQDAARTRDPATGTVPRERLLDAARFNEQALATRAQQRNSNALADAAWTERGPTNVAGRVLALLVDPADASGNTVWAGAAGGGLWKCTGATTGNFQWTSVNAFLANLAVSAVAAVPGSSPEVLYCGTGEGYFNSDAQRGAGIWKSGDGGATWTQLLSTRNANFYYVQQIVVQPTTRDVYAATRAGLWRSQNGGNSWSQVLGQDTAPTTFSNRVADLQVAADGTLFAALGLFSSDGIYRSASGNAGSWTRLNAQPNSGLPPNDYQRITLACAPSDANRVYALFQKTDRTLLGIYRSTDQGASWVALSRPGATATAPTFDFTSAQAWYGLAAAVSPADPNALYVGGLDLWFTADAGSSAPAGIVWDRESAWNAAPTSSFYVHADHHAIAFVPTGTAPANRAFFGSDSGVAYSANASVSSAGSPTFSQVNTGLNVTQFYAVAAHPTNLNYFLAGSQDNGSLKFTTAGLNATSPASGGDGGFCAIDQLNPNVQFTSYVFNQYFRSTNGGTAFSRFTLSATTGSFINPWDYDSRAGVLYAGNTSGTYLAWTNAATATDLAAATQLTPDFGAGNGSVTHVAVSPQTAGRVYFGTSAGRLLQADAAATLTPTFKILFAGANNISVSCVAVDPANERHLLLTLSNYGIVSVFETSNAEAAVPAWTAVEGNLPDMPVRWALFDPANPARALLATEMGVYATEQLSGAATAWAPASSLVNTRVDMLRYRPADQLTVAATHGRGLFTSALLQSGAPLPVVLTAFSGARAPDGSVRLRWQTASEVRSAYFQVERSTNAVDFTTLGQVTAAGASQTARAYEFADAPALAALTYYRLRQVDQDGTSVFAPTLAVAARPIGLPAAAGLLAAAYPNPLGPTLTLELTQPPTTDIGLRLFDARGRLAWATTRPASASAQLRLSLPAGLAPGAYQLLVQANGQTARRAMVKGE